MKLPPLKNIFKKSQPSAPAASFAVHPEHDWKIVVWVSLGIAAFLILFSLYLSHRIRNDDVFQVEHTNTSRPFALQQGLLDSTLSSFAAKAQKEQTLLQAPSVVADPAR